MPAASSGASSPLSAASTASLRTAVIRTLMRDRPQPAGLQRHAPGAHGGLGEAGPRLQVVPGEELVQAQVVDPLVIGEETLSSTRPSAAASGALANNNQIIHLGPLNGQYR